jgi:MFS family permease
LGIPLEEHNNVLTISGTQSYKCYFNPDNIINDERECQGPSAGVQGGITAAMTAGSWLGALMSGYLSDMLGRRPSIMVGCVLWIAGSIIICAAQNIPMLIIGRIINGLCVGIQSAQVPVYISECVPPAKRGRLVGLQQWAITWGILILY